MITQSGENYAFTYQNKGLSHKVLVWKDAKTGKWYWSAAHNCDIADTKEQAEEAAKHWIKYARVPETLKARTDQGDPEENTDS